MEVNKIIAGDALKVLKDLPDNSIDLVCTDPPYALTSIVKRFGNKDSKMTPAMKQGEGKVYGRTASGFMGKTWDAETPSIEVWAECLRVAKPGAFALVCMTPRQDSLAETIYKMGQAGWNMGFTSIYWTYASGFPKAGNIGKMVDKRNGVEREKTGEVKTHAQKGVAIAEERTAVGAGAFGEARTEELTRATSPQAKALDGSYAGFQPKPAVEVIIVAMKPLSEKTFVDQALKNRKGITWLDDVRIPTQKRDPGFKNGRPGSIFQAGDSGEVDNKGRFPANLLVSDDVLNDGTITKSPRTYKRGVASGGKTSFNTIGDPAGADSINFGDSGSYSRYFDLDKWYKTLPFMIVPKASKSEKNRGLGHFADKEAPKMDGGDFVNPQWGSDSKRTLVKNHHPTVKPLKLMSYLITLGSREKDIVLDPFVGSGTTCIAAKQLGRKYIGIEKEAEYVEIAEARLKHADKFKPIEQTRLL